MSIEIYSGNSSPSKPYDIMGQSTDTKPTDVPLGSTFLELDTLDIYIYSSVEGWVAL